MEKTLPSLVSNIVLIPLGENFSYQFVKEILATSLSPLDLAQTLILAPNHRAALTLKNLFSTLSPPNQPTLLLPKIVSLSDFSCNPLELAEINELPSLINKWQRLGILSQLIQKLPNYESTAQALKSAQALSNLLDEIQRLGIDVKCINNLAESEFAEHHQQNLRFLKIITEEWPYILKEANIIEPQEKLKLSLLSLASYWQVSPPPYRVIIAGSTGTTVGVKELMKIVLSLPQGQIFLHGFREETQNITSYPITHPQYGIQNILDFLEINFTQIHFLTSQKKLNEDRGELLKIAMGQEDLSLPANFNPYHWPEMINCSNLREEAKVIALMMRKALEETLEGDIVLVTANQTLGAWVEQELDQWKLIANQSEGVSLANTPPGHFILTVANYLKNPEISAFLSLIKHPFYEKTLNRKDHLEKVRALEIEFLHRHKYEFSELWENLVSNNPELQEWFRRHLSVLVLPFSKFQTFPLIDLVNFHINLCQKLVSLDAELSLLWEQKDGLTLKAFFENLCLNSVHFPLLTWNQYVDLLPTLLKQEEDYRKEGGIGSRLHIVGTIESRLSHAEVIILGGLNEDSWPQPLQDNPWLNRTMRQKAGFPSSEWYIGLSAHDFCGCFYAPKLYLTRSQEENESPTLHSRWWQRLEAVYQKNNLLLSKLMPYPWQEWGKALTKKTVPIRLGSPAPTPLLEARPKQYYVTDIEKLMRDPYAIYVKHCLKLKVLPFFQTPSNSLVIGRLIHFLLDQYIKTNKNKSIHHLDNFLKLSEPYFLKDTIRQAFWWKRYQKLSMWIIDQFNKTTAIKSFSEQKGIKSIMINGITIEISAIADRIDLNSNQITVVDYKTGSLPSIIEIEKGLYPQLPLEVWLVQNQAFKTIGKIAIPDIKAELWHLKGKDLPGKIVPLIMKGNFIKEVEKNLYSLLRTFLQTDIPYLACPIFEHSPVYNDYEHLERLKEWQ